MMNLVGIKENSGDSQFSTSSFLRDVPDSMLWSAFNLLEAQLCTLNAIGELYWHNKENKLFANMALPNNLNELGEKLGINNFGQIFSDAKIEDGIRTLKLEQIGILFRHNTRNGLLALQKIDTKPIYDFSSDKEAQDLKSALSEKRVILYKQPIVCVKSRNPIRFEALARMKKEDGTIALPYEFIPAAERSGLICALDICAIQIAFEQIKKIPNLHLATNVSFATISDYASRNEIYQILQHNIGHAKFLTIEVTETIAIHDFDIANEFANKVRSFGTRLSLDDFGSGHTSFKSLRELPIDEVKIDGQYVQNIHQNADTQKFIGALCHLIKDLGHELIAERVEIEEEAMALSQFPISGLQGYLFGKPQP